MTANHTRRTSAAGQDRLPHGGEYPLLQSRRLGPDDGGHPATACTFAWALVSPFDDCFELLAGSRPVARLRMGGAVFSVAELATEEDRLVFTAEGVGDRRVAVSDAGTRKVVAEFEWRRMRRDGVLRLTDGGQFQWRRSGWRQPIFAFEDRFGHQVLRFNREGRAFGRGLGTELEAPLGSPRDLTVLLAFGWLLLILTGAAVPPRPVALV